ncbi:hypothetical protein RCL1_000992 [Eukaryota sp. TZLM3-RCL]
MPWLKSSQLILDVVTVDPCNSSNEFAAEIPINLAEDIKIKKYQPFVDKLNQTQYKRNIFCPFETSIHGRIGKNGLKFLDDFKHFVKERSCKSVNLTFWTNRIVFSCLKSTPILISGELHFHGSHFDSLHGVPPCIDGCESGEIEW